MLFGKKKQEDRPLPIDEVKRMASRGMSDKDIIKELKHRGYSYNDIEKAMLQAVKEGVDEEPLPMAKPQQSNLSEIQQPMSTDELFAPPPQPAPAEFGLEAVDEAGMNEEVDTTAVLEELIEGVIDEKWHSFEDKFAKMEESFERIKTQIRNFENQIGQANNQGISKEMEAKLSDLSQQLEDLDARVGGLEKAFKQFLPSLTRNIESLSNIIHEMKEKGRVEIEEEM